MKQDCVGRPDEACVACQEQCSNSTHVTVVRDEGRPSPHSHRSSCESSSDVILLGKRPNDWDVGARKRRKIHGPRRERLILGVMNVKQELELMREASKKAKLKCERLRKKVQHIERLLENEQL
ncbi:hypothetical protein F4604DRAFT_1686350 [Suillus subluteus]|nr:hypothetical protein F4604DRAFT_1686350 [Suillus subluteus]